MTKRKFLTLKFFLFILCLSRINNVFAQNLDLISAKQSLFAQKYEEARHLIDEFALDSTNWKKPQFWYYRGLIYTTIAGDIRGKMAYVDTLFLYNAYNAYFKCIELNQKPYLDSAKNGLISLHQTTINFAGNYYKKAYQRLKLNNQFLSDTTSNFFRTAYQLANLANKMNPNDTLSYNIGAYSALYLSDYEAYNLIAEKWLSKIISPKERYHHYETWLGVCRDKWQNNPKTLEVLERALKEFPNDTKFKNARLALSAEANNERNLLDYALEKVKNNPRDPNAYFELAIIYQRFSKQPEAIVSYQKCIYLDPSNFKAIFYLGGVFYNNGAKMLQDIHTNMTFTDYQKHRKEVENQANQEFKKALPYFEQLNAMSPNHEGVLKPLYQIYKRLEMREKAEKVKIKLIAINPVYAD